MAKLDLYPLALAGAFLLNGATASAEDDVEELSRKVSNPAAYLISVPVHADFDYSRSDGKSYWSNTLDIEPVIPFSLNSDWNIITHTDFPFAYASPPGYHGENFGLGDISQDILLTPASHGPLVWAFGPQISYPTATADEFGTGKLSIGPSGLLLHQSTSITLGISASHIWSVLGEDSRPDVSHTETQPFVAWHLGKGRTISTNIDAAYDWEGKQLELPVSLSYSQIVKIGDQAVSVSAGGKYWLERPDDGPRWGIKAGLTFLFPGG